MNSWIALVLASALAGAPQAEVKPLTGEAVSGSLEAVSTMQVVVRPEQGEPVTLASRDVLAVTVPGSAEAPAPSVWLTLIDGSSLAATGYNVASGTANIRLAGGGEVSIATRLIDRVRIKEQDAALAAQWAKIPTARPRGDIIVIRKSFTNEETGAEGFSLDYLEGVLGDVTAETVGFEFDGSKIDVKREKVEGFIYFHALGRTLPDPVCEVVTSDGGRWRALELNLTAEGLELTSLAGAKATLPLDSLRRLDYSLGKIVYLSDLEALSSQSTPSLESNVATEALLKLLYGIQRDRSFEGPGLVVAGKKYDKGLALQSRTEVVFRLPGEFTKLVGLAGIDDRAGDGGSVHLVIYGDNRVIFEKRIASDDPPAEINVDLQGATRVKVLVDYADNLDNSDQLDLCELRVVK